MVFIDLFAEFGIYWRRIHHCMKSLDRYIHRHLSKNTGHKTPLWVEGEVIDRGTVLINKGIMEKVLRRD